LEQHRVEKIRVEEEQRLMRAGQGAQSWRRARAENPGWRSAGVIEIGVEGEQWWIIRAGLEECKVEREQS
jgi:hypothetical protein